MIDVVEARSEDRRPMELFAKLFSSLLVFVYHCFDRIVIHGYLSGLSRPEQVVYFFRDVIGVPVVDKAVLSKRTGEYRGLGRGIRPQPQDPHRVGPKRCPQRRLRPTRVAPHGAGRPLTASISSFKSMEQGRDLPLFHAQVPHPGSQPPHSARSSGVASRTTTSTCGMKRWDRW